MSPSEPPRPISSDTIRLMLKQQETRDEAARADQSGLPPWRWALREAAAVLASFDPRELEPARENPDRWREFLPDCEAVDLPGGHGRWRLRSSIRRQTLRRLGSRQAMRRALEPYRGHADEPLQRAIERLLDALAEIRSEDWGRSDVLGPATVNIGTLSGGLAANVIAPEAEATVFIRVVGSAAEARGKLEKILATDSVFIAVVADHLTGPRGVVALL